MKIRNFIVSMMAVAAVFTGCENETDFLGLPSLKLNEKELAFEQTESSAPVSFTATRDWTATTDAEWIAITPESGKGSVSEQSLSISVLENTGMDRSAVVALSIGMTTRNISVAQKGPKGSAEQMIIYSNNFDKEEATKTYGSGESWPYLDQFDGWQNQTGTGSAGVSYAYNGMSARANSTSNSNYSDYAGSGSNNMFFGSNAYLSIKDIALNGATDFTLTFGTEKYSQTNGSVFMPSEFHLYVSNDNAKWVELEYVFAGGETEGRWNVATCNFSVPSGTEKIALTVAVDVASSYRMDDFHLVIAQETSEQVVDFAAGVEKDFGTGSSSGGGSSSAPESKGKKTVAEFITAADASNYYELTGTVSGFNAKYCSFDLTDASGEIYVYSVLDESKSEWSSKIKNGGTITIYGKYLYYEQKQQHEVVDAYIVSYTDGASSGDDNTGGSEPQTGYVFKKVSTITSGKSYLLVAGTKAGVPFASDKNYGYMNVTDVTDNNGEIVSSADNAFEFTAVDGGYSIKQSDGRYLIMDGDYNSFNLSESAGTAGVWAVEAQSDGTFKITNVEKAKWIQYSSEYSSYGSYPDDRGEYPVLYEMTDETGEIEGGSTGGGSTGGDVEQPSDLEHPLSNNITWTLGSSAYDSTSGSTAQSGSVNGVSVNEMLKLGTSSKVGNATLHVPAGTKKLGFYMVAWKGKTAELKMTVAGSEIESIAPASNDGASGNPPYTITLSEDDYYEVEVNAASATDVEITTVDPANGRVIIFGINAYTE